MALIDNLKGLLEQAKEKAGPLAEQAKEKAGPLAAQAKDKATELAAKAAPSVASGFDKAAGGFDKATGGRFSDKVDAVQGKVHDTAGKVASTGTIGDALRAKNEAVAQATREAEQRDGSAGVSPTETTQADAEAAFGEQTHQEDS